MNHMKSKNNNQNKRNIEDHNTFNTIVQVYFGNVSKISKSMLGKLGSHTMYRVACKSNMIRLLIG